MADAAALATAFGRVLRGAGLNVPVDSVLTFTEAVGAIGLDRRDSVYWAGRATLVHRPEDIGVYDRAFTAFWDRQAPATAGEPEPELVHLTIAVDDGDEGDEADDDDAEAADEPDITLRFSRTEVLRHRDFAAYNAAELDEAQRLMADLRLAGSLRRSRRLVRSRRSRGRIDLRRTVRAALRAEGEAVRTVHLEQGTRPRRLILLIDISGSMESYARALLRFVHAAVAGRQKVEAFAIGTRLTRMTRRAGVARPRRRAAAGGRAGHGLVRGHPSGRRPPPVQRPVGRAGPSPRGHRGGAVRRLGSGRSGRAG